MPKDPTVPLNHENKTCSKCLRPNSKSVRRRGGQHAKTAQSSNSRLTPYLHPTRFLHLHDLGHRDAARMAGSGLEVGKMLEAPSAFKHRPIRHAPGPEEGFNTLTRKGK